MISSTNSSKVAYTSDKEDKGLYSRADDALRLSSLRKKPFFLGFLNEREQFMLKNYISQFDCFCRFYGGYDGAVRNILSVSVYEIDDNIFPIDVVYFKYRKSDALSHRDFLGALMNLGIERSSIGDIIVNEGCAVCYVRQEIGDYVRSQISKIGRVGVKIVSGNECNITTGCNIESLSFIVNSMRLDVIVAAITGLSREKTAALILAGKTFVNYTENKNVSHILKEDDILTIRGNGKFIIKEQAGVTKKGRLKLIIEHYR